MSEVERRIHELADVRSDSIGEGTVIWQYVVILPGASIGSHCNINCHVLIEDDVVVGDRVTVKSGVQLWNGIRADDDVFIGPNVTFTNDLLPRSKQHPETFMETYLRKGASIGANATVLAGVEIGTFALIGAGSVVTTDVAPYTLWYGNPARHRGYVTRAGEVLDLDLRSRDGDRQFEFNNGELVERL